jgi:transposase-like protein
MSESDSPNGLGEARQRSTPWRRDYLLRGRLIEGRLSTASAKDELVKLATRLIVEEALEGEAGDALGREYYEHGAQPGQGYRNGYRPGRLKTAEGPLDYSGATDCRAG